MICSREYNLRAILADMSEQGIGYRLENGVFKFDGKAALMTEDLREGLKQARPGLSALLRSDAGLCTVCGLECSVRPFAAKRTERHWCEACYWQIVTPISYRLGLTDTQRKRQDKENDRISNTEVHTTAALPTLL